jgi:hypothetical protein
MFKFRVHVNVKLSYDITVNYKRRSENFRSDSFYFIPQEPRDIESGKKYFKEYVEH